MHEVFMLRESRRWSHHLWCDIKAMTIQDGFHPVTHVKAVFLAQLRIFTYEALNSS